MQDLPISAELSARITAAEAVRKDFHHAVDLYLDQGAARPDFQGWAFRLSSGLASVLRELDAAKATS